MPARLSEWPMNKYPPTASFAAEAGKQRLLRAPVEINDHVAAENDVQMLVEAEPHEVQPAEANVLPRLRSDAHESARVVLAAQKVAPSQFGGYGPDLGLA